MKSKEIIKLHPRGEDGGLIPLKAMQLLKPGMTLKLLPAEYWETIEIPTDRVMVTTDGNRIEYSIRVKGRDSIVNNVRCNSVSIVEDAIILDSLVNEIHIGNWEYESKIKVNVDIYNTACNTFSTLGGENNSYTVEMKNCLIRSNCVIYSNTKMSITDSIILSPEYVFTFNELWNSKKGRLLLKNNLLNGKMGYARMAESPSDKKRGVSVVEAKDIRKLWSTNMSGKHIYEAPKFQSKLKLFLTEDSPGKGRGLIPEEHPQFEIMKKKKDDALANRDEEEKRRREERERENADRRIREEDRDRRRDREEKDPPVDLGDIGDLPKPPE